MKAEFINPFIEATMNVLTTMAMVSPIPGKPILKTGDKPNGDLTGVIGLVGQKVTGSMAIVLPADCATKIASNMLGENFAEINADVVDCVGELTNMITGGAKAKLGEMGYRFEMAIPSMIRGKEHVVYHRTKGPVVCIPFDLDGSFFYVEACFSTNE